MILPLWAMCRRSADSVIFMPTMSAPWQGKTTRAFVIISDALRYEGGGGAQRDAGSLHQGYGKTGIHAGDFPLHHQVRYGRAASCQRLGVDEDMEVLADGLPTRSTVERQKILCAANSKSVAVQYTDILNMKRAERRERVSGKDVVYIYHNTIDAIGDKSVTEQKVFEACEDTVQELSICSASWSTICRAPMFSLRQITGSLHIQPLPKVTSSAGMLLTERFLNWDGAMG